MIPKSCDVVVIGGGPGGSTTATHLARYGYDVVLLDKQVHPRYNVGESLIPLFWRYIDAVGATDKILNEGFVRKMGGTVRWRGRINTHTFKAFGYDRPAYHIERDRFDFLLLENAREHGVQVCEGIPVTNVSFEDASQPAANYRDPDHGAGQIRCRYVVDASGQGALLARQFGIQRIDQDFRYMSVWGYYRDSKYIAFGGKAHPAENMFTHPPTTFVTSLENFGDVGWGWHIPMRNETSVGYVLPVDRIKSQKREGEDWEAFFLRMGRETYGYCQLLEEARFVEGSVRLIRDYSYQADRLAGPGYFMVGDAAGFIDPIFSIGVVLALYSGYAAAWGIDRILKDPASEERTLEMYERELRSRIELSRHLALPSYQPDREVSEMVLEAVAREGGASLNLMSAVSRLTSRSHNFNQMAQRVGERKLDPEMFIELEELEL